MNADKVVWGTAYYPDHWPESEWERDLRRIREAGITRVRFGEFSWSWYEPEPGKFDFAPFDRFVDLVEGLGLSLCLCTPTATPPPWMDDLFPNGRLEDMHGRRCLSHRHFWCWNHPAAKKKAEQVMETIAERYGKHPHVWGWQIDNEPNYAEQIRLGDPESMYDWNPHSRAHFARWLEQRYGAVDALNEAWWTNFWSQRMRSWEEAARPRGRTNPHAWLDFMRWREANLAEQIQWQANVLRRVCPHARVGTNIPETGVPLSVNIGQNYWSQAQSLDWVGTDLYQASGDSRRDLERLAFSTDLMRSVADATGAEFVIAETQGGPHERAWPNPFARAGIGPDYLRSSVDCYRTRGAKQVWWFLWRPTLGGAELGMNGVQKLNGENSERTDVARKAATASPSQLAMRWRSRPTAHVHYSRDSLLHRSAFCSDLGDLQTSFEGWHTLLEDCGYRVQFVDDHALTALEAPTCLIAPHTIVCSANVVHAIAALTIPVISGPHLAMCDENGQLRPEGLPEPLRLRFGVVSGLWRDVGEIPLLPGCGKIPGYRTLVPTGACPTRARYRNREVAAAGLNGALLGFDAGPLYANGTPRQRKTLRDLLNRIRKGTPRLLA